jgi:16S rRNA (cytosine1402-N4)-methyltransferase
MEPFPHITVLRDEVCAFVAPHPGGLYLDVTLGLGGHTEALLTASSPDGRVVAIDRDPSAIAYARTRLARFGDRVEFHETTMSSLREVLDRRKVDGLVADLGVSSPQLDDAARGMSFRHEGPLDMRMGPDAHTTAWRLVRELHESQLADVIYEHGEERRSRPIARSIKRAIEEKRMETTADLAAAVHAVLGRGRPGMIDPATRTFQALRIAVNDEMGELERLIVRAPDALNEGAVVAVISFHSLEDRRVKHGFRADPRLDVLTSKPVEASDEEKAHNPRARSAKLRAARKIP